MSQQRTVSVKVSLLASEYFTGLRKMQEETKKTATTAEQAFRRQTAVYHEFGRGASVASLTFLGATAAMIKATADFEQRMSQVQAVSKATTGQMSQLSNAAFTAGKAFGLSATQVADAQIELTKAGVSVKDVVGGALPGALALSAAGQLDVAKATEIATTAMTQFSLKGADVPHLADLLAAGADKSIASVESLGDSLNQSGQVAAQFGLSVEDTVGTLTAFSKAGLNGSDAGTSFKTMLTQLASPTKQAQELLDKYNITTYDAQGNFVGITALADNLRKGLGTLSQQQRNAALSTIFGNDAIRASGTLYELGGKKLQGYIDANNEAGFATLQASKKLDNLNGDVQKLSAAFQNDLIKGGSAGNDALRGVTQTATGLLDVVAGLPKPVAAVGFGLTAVAGATTAAGAAFFLLTPKVAAAKLAMADMNLTGKGLAATFGKGAALTVGLSAVAGGIANLGAEGTVNSQQLAQAADRIKGSYKDIDKAFPDSGNPFPGFTTTGAQASLEYLTSTLGVSQRIASNFIDGASAAITFGQAGTHLGDVFKSNQETFNATGQQLAGLAHTDYSSASASFGRLVEQLGGGNDAARAALQYMPAYREEIVKLLAASGQAANEQNILAGSAGGNNGVAAKIREAQAAAASNETALTKMSGAASGATADISKLSEAIKGFGAVTLDARGAQRDFEAAVDGAADAAKKNGRNLDISTEAGRANQTALDGIASAAFEASSAILEQSGSQDDAAAAIRRGRKAFLDSAQSMGLSRTAAEKLADRLNLIPSNVKTAVSIFGVDAATAALDQVYRKVVDLNGRRVTISTVVRQDGSSTTSGGGGTVIRRASGGPITGPGPKGKDSVLMWGAPGEHVLPANEVDRMGGQAAVYAFRKSIRGYAAGGAIGGSSVLEQSRAQFIAGLSKQKTAPTSSSILEAKAEAAAADRRADTLTRQIVAAKRAAAARVSAVALAEKAADRAEKIAGDIDGSKKNRAAKKAAQRDVETARKQVEVAKKQSDAAQDQVEKLRDKRTDQQTKRDDALTKAQKLREDREDFVSQQRRGVTDPLTYIDQLRSMSRDDNFSDARREQFKDTANDYEQALVDLTKKSQDATDKLDGLKSAADSMRSGITSAIAGGYQLTGAGSIESTGSTFVRDGISYQTTSTGVSADALDAYYQKGAGTASGFASDLQALAARGLDGRLLAELAGYGVEQGAPIARALLSATTGQVSSINANYSSIQGSAASAAGTVTDVNYKALIEAAQTVADGIAAQIADDSAKLRTLIASAFGLTGYAVGTMNASRGLHLVGEKGPELLNFAGGEQVITAARTRALMAGARPSSQTVVRMPDTITVRDASGFTATMKVVAQQEIAADQAQDAVLRWGGAA